MTQQLQRKKPNSKLGKELQYLFLQRSYTDDQQAYEMILNITNP